MKIIAGLLTGSVLVTTVMAMQSAEAGYTYPTTTTTKPTTTTTVPSSTTTTTCPDCTPNTVVATTTTTILVVTTSSTITTTSTTTSSIPQTTSTSSTSVPTSLTTTSSSAAPTTTASPPSSTPSSTPTTSSTLPATSSTTTTTTLPATFSFGAAGTVCVREVPTIRITFQNLFPPLAGQTGTLTMRDINGNVVSSQPLVYQPGTTVDILYPGTAVNPDGSIADVPGWILNSDGFWVQDPSDEFLREGIFLTYELNPIAGPVLVTYPPESSACANPSGPFQPSRLVLPVTL